MLDSYELVEVATWMMIAGGLASGISLMGMFLSNGLGFLMVGVFLDHYYY